MRKIAKPLAAASLASALLASNPAEAWVDRHFHRFFNDPFFAPELERVHSAGITMYEKGEKLYIEAPLPGVDEDDVELTLEKGVLAITGKRKSEEEEGAQYYYRSSNHFNYRVALPETIDQSSPDATFKNGLMQIVFDKREELQPRKIEFRS